jgi:hypothetical protein
MVVLLADIQILRIWHVNLFIELLVVVEGVLEEMVVLLPNDIALLVIVYRMVIAVPPTIDIIVKVNVTLQATKR